jgi:hypothetical protein
VSGEARVVTDLGIGCHFGAAFMTRPILGLSNKFAANTVVTRIGLNVPTFEITDVIRLAIFHEGTDAGFEKADKTAVPRIGDQNALRFDVVEDIEHFGTMICIVILVPQQLAETEPLFQVRITDRPNGKVAIRHQRES